MIVPHLLPAIESKLMVTRAALGFGIVVLEKMRLCQQEPIQKDDVKDFHQIQHGQEPGKKHPEAVTTLNSIQSAKKKRADMRSSAELTVSWAVRPPFSMGSSPAPPCWAKRYAVWSGIWTKPKATAIWKWRYPASLRIFLAHCWRFRWVPAC